jgi:hypothetical protein
VKKVKIFAFFHRNISVLVSKAGQKPDVSVNTNLPKSINLILLIISLLGLSLFQLNSFAVYLNSSGSLINKTTSSLVYAPYGWLQTLAFYILSLSILALAILLQFKAPVKLNLGAITLALIGFALFIIGTFPTQFPGEPFMAGVHKLAAIIIFILLPIAGFFLTASFKTWNYRFLYKFTMISSILQVVFIFIGGLLLVMHLELFGLFERVLLLNGQIWLTGICLNFLLAETRYDFPIISRKRPVTKPAVYCLLYAYVSILLPISLSLVKAPFW